MKDFWKRTASATVYAILFIGSILAPKWCEAIEKSLGLNWLDGQMVGRTIFYLFLLFIAIGCTFEFFRIVKKQSARPCITLGYILSFALVTFNYCSLFSKPSTAILYLLIISFALSLIIQLWKKSEQPFRDAAYTVTPALYIGLPLGLMYNISVEYAMLIPILALVWINDSAAYMGGSLLKGRKLWERHSPGKTLSGALVGTVVTMLVSLVLINFTHLEWYEALILALICSIIGTLGDLVESMLKRSVNIKDSGKIMPGHGGFLDRFDSLLIIMPFAYIFFSIIKY